MRQRWIAAVVAGLSITVAACAGHGPNTGATPKEPMVVSVRNNNWADVNVFAVREGVTMRLGFVTGLGAAKLRVPENASPDGMLQLMVDPIGSSTTYTTEKFLVSPGQWIELNVNPQLRMSSYAVVSR